MVDLTYKMIAYKLNTDECIDWAIEMLCEGFETYNLKILAGLSKPSNYFETIQILDKAIDELGIDKSKWKNAEFPYRYYLIKKMAKSENIKENLYEMMKFSMGPDTFLDFHLLCFAWSDFDYGKKSSCYWAGATRENISNIVVKTANEWLTKNIKEIEIEFKINHH